MSEAAPKKKVVAKPAPAPVVVETPVAMPAAPVAEAQAPAEGSSN